MEFEQLQRAIEAILFAAGEPVETVRLAHALETDIHEVIRAAQALLDAYAFERRGVRIVRLDKAWQMVSSGEMADYVTKALETRKPPKLSGAQLVRRLVQYGVLKLKNLFRGNRSRSEVVATFLAILELCKTNSVTLEDDVNGENPNVRLLKVPDPTGKEDADGV